MKDIIAALRAAARQAESFRYCCAGCHHTIGLNSGPRWVDGRPFHEVCARKADAKR